MPFSITVWRRRLASPFGMAVMHRRLTIWRGPLFFSDFFFVQLGFFPVFVFVSLFYAFIFNENASNLILNERIVQLTF